ncbi:hypothetical protein BKA70DRAFT_1280029 [Coprinopsis sp. MPI-PUGE-AT-0042]|nr:hypothetical protein BKA70DRAFT_1280029 [Coprinopsis sp. MPI-PUGE-AT-0042]
MPLAHLRQILSQTLALKHLSFAPKESTLDSLPLSGGSNASLVDGSRESLLAGVRLSSLAIFDHIPVRFVQGNLSPEERKPDISLIHELDLSKLKRLYFGCDTKGSREVQGDLNMILLQCTETLEELRVCPAFGPDLGPVSYLKSSQCPRLDNFPCLRMLETCLEASIGPMERMNPETGEYTYMKGRYAAVNEAFASFLSTAGSNNAIEYIRLYIHVHSAQWNSWRGQPEGEVFRAIRETLTPDYAERLGLNHLDRVLSAPDGKFNVLKKLSLILLPLQQFKYCDQVALLDVFRTIFADWELEKSGKLMISFLEGHRLIKDVTDWVGASVY